MMINFSFKTFRFFVCFHVHQFQISCIHHQDEDLSVNLRDCVRKRWERISGIFPFHFRSHPTLRSCGAHSITHAHVLDFWCFECSIFASSFSYLLAADLKGSWLVSRNQKYMKNRKQKHKSFFFAFSFWQVLKLIEGCFREDISLFVYFRYILCSNIDYMKIKFIWMLFFLWILREEWGKMRKF